mgnify:CR=1 FL=1
MEKYLDDRDISEPLRVCRRVEVMAPAGRYPSEDLESFINAEASVLDCGKGTRDKFDDLSELAGVTETIDAFVYEDYPSILFDLCSPGLPSGLAHRFDTIFCFSILEHVPNPFLAAQNLLGMLRPGGVIVGYVPWLFPYHAGRGLSQAGYEDFWRFSPEAIGLLFAGASSIRVFPKRGRVATALMILFFTKGRNLWKELESRPSFLFSRVSRLASRGNERWQASGYEFVISTGSKPSTV